MIRADVYFTSKDLKTLRRRADHLATRVAERDTAGEQNAPGAGYDRVELSALRRVLSQVDEKGIEQFAATREPLERGSIAKFPWRASADGLTVERADKSEEKEQL